MYLELVPRVGFKPAPEGARLQGSAGRSETETHRLILRAEVERIRKMKRSYVSASCVTIHTPEGERVVPRRVAASVAYALRAAYAGEGVKVGGPTEKRWTHAGELERVCAGALAALG